jgi:hypothetical protein
MDAAVRSAIVMPSPENALNTTKIVTIGILTSTAASASFAGDPVALGVTLGSALGTSLGVTLGTALGSVMSGVDVLLGNGPLLGVTVASLLLGIVIARRKLRR